MILLLLVPVVFLLIFSSCFSEEKFENTKKGNFEALWKIIDERYCFFDYKGVDWLEVRERYSPRITEDLTNDAFFDILAEMLAELRDGHVNLIASHNISRYWVWEADSVKDNFDAKIQKEYLKTDYLIAGSLKYKVLEDSIGYVYYESFSNGFSEANLDHVIYRLYRCKGIIIDVRDNGGGLLSNVEKLASRFFDEKTLVGYIIHKTGKGHNDFSSPYKRYIESSYRIRYPRKVAVLTNRKCYSATNDFVNAMGYSPNVTIIGDKTGGGSGLPFSSELPNGWSVRFSASPMLNAEKEHTEFGIDPDIKVDMTGTDMIKSVDTIIEAARKYLLENQ
nr:S41 family peptidase [Dysgonomonas sp. 216]